MREVRPARVCRSWLFLEGANADALQRAPDSGADVLIELPTYGNARRPLAWAAELRRYATRRAP